MRYLSVCSGIEAATVAWHHMGWKPVAFSEIEKFPSEVLQHHYPDVANLGDMNKFKEWSVDGTVDLIVGGTPCQSFSVAGLRKGLEDPRGNLALTFCALLNKFRPKWFVWENVPGVLSSNKGRDFSSFISAVAQLGYGFSYRVLDAQNFGVAQRRRRVFVVGHLGDWKPTAEVLFESSSLQWDTKKSKEKREKTSTDPIPSVANCLQTTCNNFSRSDGFNMIPLLHQDYVDALCARDYKGLNSDSLHRKAIVETLAYSADKAPTLTSSAAGISRVGNDTTADSQYIAFHATQDPISGDKSPCIGAIGKIGVMDKSDAMRVRRLTPIECERLQGFPDGYTDIKDKCPDGPRYKALGNSMAVPVMRWIGERINKIEPKYQD